MTPEQLYEELILTVEVDEYGNKYWYNSNNKFHRMLGPAIEYKEGGMEWYQNGVLHRENGPAMTYSNGTKYWFQTGLLHRTDGPAIEYASGKKEWWMEGIKLK